MEVNKKYFTAEEARKFSDDICSGRMNDELNWVYKAIDKARCEGRYEVTFYNKSLMKSTLEFLESKGFKISYFTGCQRDPANDITISW